VNEAMLTGESTPQMKEALESGADGVEDYFQLGAGVTGDAEVRSHLVSGGTKVIQQAVSKEKEREKEGPSSSSQPGLPSVPRPPDRGCVAFVLRTGFGTSQGQLMRTILFTTRMVMAGSAETLVFIAILLVFAMVASVYVLLEGIKDETRNRFKLLLHCIMIVTSVVPPELPMELSLAVTNSLAALTKNLIYCTEPFRIPFAGKVTTCCFDKTGTLTSDDLVLQGVVLAPADSGKAREKPGKGNAAGATVVPKVVEHVTPPDEVLGPSLWVMAACQALMQVDGKVVGDPMEKAALEGIGWSCPNGEVAFPPPQRRGPDLVPIRIHHRYPFSSSLRRMSVLVSLGGRDRPLMVLCKGAPEAVQALLKAVPPFYEPTYLHHMGRGRRVLALALRTLPESVEPVTVRHWARDEAERDLQFVGFMVIDCPLKRDTKHVLHALRASSHRTVMITGDSALTAAEVARQVGMIPHGPEETIHLVPYSDEPQARGFPLHWVSMRLGEAEGGDEPVAIPFVLENLEDLARQYSLCLEGEALSLFLQACGGGKGEDAPAESDAARSASTDEGDEDASGKRVLLSSEGLRSLSRLCPHVTVFARVAPDQKEMLIAALNAAGEVTLMCGDGTNDVGALKQAHVGVSIINSPELEKRAERLGAVYERRLQQMDRMGPNGQAMARAKRSAEEEEQERERTSRLAAILAELNEQENDPAIVQLGDASIASPFTAKRTSVDCVLSVVRQGRCTLVTTLQVYKILALNCLVSAYMLSSLYLFGVKQADVQMTIVGLAIAALFFLVSRAEPLDKLSAERPPARIFCLQVCVSIVLQFVVHLGCLLVTLEMCRPFVRPDDPSMAPDGHFHPNIINTAVFLLSAVMQVNTFTANYRGHPFMQSLTENSALGYFTAGLYLVLALLASGILQPLNNFLQLVPCPSMDFRLRFMGLLVIDTASVVLIEMACLMLFKPKQPGIRA
jgi:manganese-transporting P-type ATPase